LIAEQVDKVYPELLIRHPKGTIQGVHYEELAPILLNEVQQQQSTIEAQAVKIDALTAQSDSQSAEIRELKKSVLEMQAGILELQSKDELVALKMRHPYGRDIDCS
jgi:hypothetical protein